MRADDEDRLAAGNLHVHAGNALGVFGFEFFGDAQQAGEQPHLAAPLAIERGVGRVLELRFGFGIMITHQRGDHVAPPAAQFRDFSVADQVFAMAMMRFARDEMADVVQQRAHFQHQAQVRAHFVDGAQLIEQRQCEARDLLGVLRIVIEAPREPARAGQQFRGAALFFFRRGADGILLRDQIEQDSFAHTDTGNQHGAQVEPFRQRIENNRGDADHFGAVLAHPEDAHAAGNIEREHAPGLIAQQARIDRGDALDHGSGGDAHQRFGVSAAGDGDGAAEASEGKESRCAEARECGGAGGCALSSSIAPSMEKVSIRRMVPSGRPMRCSSTPR